MVFGFPSLGIGGKVIGLNHRHRLCFQANCLPNSAVHLSPSSEAFFFDCSHISSVRQVWRLKKRTHAAEIDSATWILSCPSLEIRDKSNEEYPKEKEWENIGHISTHPVLHFQSSTSVGFCHKVFPTPAPFTHSEEQENQRSPLAE